MKMPIISLLQSLMQTAIKLEQILATNPNHTAYVPRDLNGESWGFANVVHHLLLSEEKFLARFKQIVGQQEETLMPFTADDEPPHQITDPISTQIAQFAIARTQTISYLRQLPPEEWQKEMYHPDYGQADLHFHVQNMFAHDREHINQMQKIADRYQILDVTPTP